MARKPRPRASASIEPAPVSSTAVQAIEGLHLSPPVKDALRNIQAEVADAYRERFIEMTEAMRHQASTLARIQETLHILVQAVAPQLAGTVPAAVRVASDGEKPDIASTLVIADPIGTGYTLSQADLAKALGLSNAADVSILVRAFKLDEDGECAVVVRRGEGNKNKFVNYHPRAVARFRACVEAPPANVTLTADQRSALKRIHKKLLAPASSK